MWGTTGDGGGRRGSRWRFMAWVAAALLLLVPLVAMRFTNEVNWAGSDFAIAAVLLFGSLGAYELVVRISGSMAYRAGAGVALAAVFLLVWVNGAVGITDSAADGAFLLVPAVGFLGALFARFQSRGMVLALVAMAIVQTLIAVFALMAGVVPSFNSPFEILGITFFFVALFVASALLFLEAARGRTERVEA